MLDLLKRLLIVLVMGFCIACMFFSLKSVNAEETPATIQVVANEVVWPANGEALKKETSSIAYYYLANYDITSGYGWRKDPINGQEKMHNGIDLSKEGNIDLGDPVFTVKDGTIEEIEKMNHGAGYTVLIQHTDKTQSKYAHLMSGSTDGLKVGQFVRAGDIIGKLGNTGHSTGPHLHLEMTDVSGELIDGSIELHRLAEEIVMAFKVQDEINRKKEDVQLESLREYYDGENEANWKVVKKSKRYLASSVLVSSREVKEKIRENILIKFLYPEFWM